MNILQMKYLLLLCCMLATSVTAEYLYSVGEDKFQLKVNYKDVITDFGQELNYSVYKNNHIIYSRDKRGQFFSCKPGPPGIEPVQSESRQIGWMIVGAGICGNTFSYLVEIIVPINNPYVSNHGTYLAKRFVSKDMPIVTSYKEGLEVWYYQQNWGNGGTATSIFMPRKLLIKTDGYEPGIYKGNILNNISFIENIEVNKWPEWLKPGFLGLFVAGLEDVNAPLMRYAIDNYYSESDKDWYENYFASGNKEYVIDLVNRVENLRKLYEEIRYSVSWDMVLNEQIQPAKKNNAVD